MAKHKMALPNGFHFNWQESALKKVLDAIFLVILPSERAQMINWAGLPPFSGVKVQIVGCSAGETK